MGVAASKGRRVSNCDVVDHAPESRKIHNFNDWVTSRIVPNYVTDVFFQMFYIFLRDLHRVDSFLTHLAQIVVDNFLLICLETQVPCILWAVDIHIHTRYLGHAAVKLEFACIEMNDERLFTIRSANNAVVYLTIGHVPFCVR